MPRRTRSKPKDAPPPVTKCGACGRQWTDDPAPDRCPRCEAPLKQPSNKVNQHRKTRRT